MAVIHHVLIGFELLYRLIVEGAHGLRIEQ